MYNSKEDTILTIFYDHRSLGGLITHCIKPFINKSLDEGTLLKYYIYIGTLTGDHITVSFKPHYLEKKLSIEAERYLCINPSQKHDLHISDNGLFEYPSNSVWFNIDHPYFFIDNKNSIDIDQQISYLIIDALGNVEIDLEAIYTFVIYMQLGIIKAAYPVINDAYKGVEVLLEHLNFLQNSSNTSEKNNSLFDTNEEILKEIIKEIWYENSLEVVWLNIWISTCEKVLTREKFDHAFVLLSEIIYEHTGLNKKNMVDLSRQMLLVSINN